MSRKAAEDRQGDARHEDARHEDARGEDARFEDGGEAPLRLRAFDADDLRVISALVQDAVLPGNEMTWQPKPRRFALLLNRFRWEDREAAERRHRPVERVRSVLTVEDVLKVRSAGVGRDAGTVYSLLSLDFMPGADGTGTLVMAGDGAVELEVETLEVTLTDVTRPWLDPARRAPDHPDGD